MIPNSKPTFLKEYKFYVKIFVQWKKYHLFSLTISLVSLKSCLAVALVPTFFKQCATKGRDLSPISAPDGYSINQTFSILFRLGQNWRTKGQLISKGLFIILKSSKKRKKIDLTTMIHQVDLFSFVFWKNLKSPKRHFEINWPLRWDGKFLLGPLQ